MKTSKDGWEVIIKKGGLLDESTTIGIKQKFVDTYWGAYTKLPDVIQYKAKEGDFVTKVAEALTYYIGQTHPCAEPCETPWKKVLDKMNDLYSMRRKVAITSTDINYTAEGWIKANTTNQPNWIGVDCSTPWDANDPYKYTYTSSPSWHTTGPPYTVSWPQWKCTTETTETTNQEEEEMSAEQFVRAEFVAIDNQKLEEIVKGSVIAKDDSLARTKFIVENKIDVDLVGEGLVTVIILQSNTFTRYTETVKLEIEV